MAKRFGIIVIAFVLVLLSLPVISGMVKPIEAKDSLIQITGYSMYPTLREGEVVDCEAGSDYRVGDIIVFDKSGSIIGHRILGVLGGKFITKGDHNLIPDLFLVDRENVICRIRN